MLRDGATRRVARTFARALHVVWTARAHAEIARNGRGVAGVEGRTAEAPRRTPVRTPADVATRTGLPCKRWLLEAPESEIGPTYCCMPKLAPVAKFVRVKEVEPPVVMRCRVVELEEVLDLRQRGRRASAGALTHRNVTVASIRSPGKCQSRVVREPIERVSKAIGQGCITNPPPVDVHRVCAKVARTLVASVAMHAEDA